MHCPICNSERTNLPRQDLMPHPYVECLRCHIYFQPNMKPKVYEAHHEVSGDMMSERDKEANRTLAQALYTNHISKLDRQAGIRHLDIGSKYPYLGHCLQKLGPLSSHGIDGIDKASNFGEQLNVIMHQRDFENDDLVDLGKFDVITIVHCLEHMYKPVKALRKMRDLLRDDGILFIRSPDHMVAGIERDFTSGHYDIHPLIWTEEALYEALAQLEDCFEVYETYPIGYGQRDWLLRSISKKPTICAGYIAKNEERDLPASLDSLKGVVDDICVVDTGSTDNTVYIAKSKNAYTTTYLEASERDDKGDWKLWDFSKARNKYVTLIDRSNDWLLWMDADDTLTSDAADIIRRAPYMPYDIHGFQIKTGQDSHLHHRLWRTGRDVHYEGACHEYPRWPVTFKSKEWSAEIIHNGADGFGESSTKRNLRILDREVKEAPTPRGLFYLANTYRDAYGITSNTEEDRRNYLDMAVETYGKYLSSPGFHDEMMFAYIYKARCLRLKREYDNCIQTVREAVAKDPSFAELYMEACYAESNRGNHWKAISWALQARDLPFQKRLFAERNKYEDQPVRMITHSYLSLGYKDMALDWGKLVVGYVKDVSWEDFLKSTSATINILRPGAIGDILMTGYVLKGLRKKHPGCKIVYYTKCPDVAKILPVDEVGDSSEWETRQVGYDYPLIGYSVKDGYPKVALKKHLVELFAEEVGVNPEAPEVTLDPITHEGGYITLHAKAGWSPYKNWDVNNWTIIADRLRASGYTVIQVGSETDPVVGRCYDYRGKTTVSETLALIKGARLHLGVDSFTNHAAGLFKTPAVILFGSTSPTGSGYSTADNVWLGLTCSPCYKEDPKISRDSQGICENPPNQTYEEPRHACMQGIDVERVFAVIQTRLSMVR